MGKKLSELTKEDLKMVRTPALASKHRCSDVYVRFVLKGYRPANTPLAKMILMDANDILEILGRDTHPLIMSEG